SNDDYGNGSYKSSVFHDKDGSVGGVPDSFIVINGGIALDDACEIKPTWNAAVCKGDIGRMTVGGGDGPAGFGDVEPLGSGAPGGRGAAADPRAPAGRGAAAGPGGPGARKGRG